MNVTLTVFGYIVFANASVFSLSFENDKKVLNNKELKIFHYFPKHFFSLLQIY